MRYQRGMFTLTWRDWPCFFGKSLVGMGHGFRFRLARKRVAFCCFELAKVPRRQRCFSIGSDVSALGRAAAACKAGFARWSTVVNMGCMQNCHDFRSQIRSGSEKVSLNIQGSWQRDGSVWTAGAVALKVLSRKFESSFLKLSKSQSSS